MFSETRQRIGNLLNGDNFATVVEYASQYNVSPDAALNQIVLDWTEKREGSGTLSKANSGDLKAIWNKLLEIDMRTKEIESKENEILNWIED